MENKNEMSLAFEKAKEKVGEMTKMPEPALDNVFLKFIYAYTKL